VNTQNIWGCWVSGLEFCTEVAYSIVTATSVQWYNQRLAYVNLLYHSFYMAQANSAKLSIVVRSICCSKVKNVDHDEVSSDLPDSQASEASARRYLARTSEHEVYPENRDAD
jgi:hypothetical protein